MVTQLREREVDVITRGHLTKGLDSLPEEFAGVFSAQTIERSMAESLYVLKDSGIDIGKEFPKPMTDDLEGVRRIREDITARVRGLLDDITSESG